MIWASSRQNLSSVSDSYIVEYFTCGRSRYDTVHQANNKGPDQTAWMSRLVCAFVVHKPPKTGFLVSWSISWWLWVKVAQYLLFYIAVKFHWPKLQSVQRNVSSLQLLRLSLKTKPIKNAVSWARCYKTFSCRTHLSMKF